MTKISIDFMCTEGRKQSRKLPTSILPPSKSHCINLHFFCQTPTVGISSWFASEDLFLWFLASISADLQLPKQKPSGSVLTQRLSDPTLNLSVLCWHKNTSHTIICNLLSLVSALQFSNLGAAHTAFMLFNILLIKLKALHWNCMMRQINFESVNFLTAAIHAVLSSVLKTDIMK